MINFKRTVTTLSAAILCGSTVAHAHARLDHASPAVGSTVSSSPAQVTLNFTEKLEPKFSAAEVHSAAGARVDAGSSVSGNVLTVNVKGLSAGAYTVNWHVLSVDTHKTQGSFHFSVGK